MKKETKFKSGFIAIVGRPNVGKSTLMNRLVGEKVVITSNKPQTTRNRISGIYTSDDMQVVFVDTPGIFKPHSKLDEYMDKASYSSLNDVDLVMFMVEPDEAGNAVFHPVWAARLHPGRTGIDGRVPVPPDGINEEIQL